MAPRKADKRAWIAWHTRQNQYPPRKKPNTSLQRYYGGTYDRADEQERARKYALDTAHQAAAAQAVALPAAPPPPPPPSGPAATPGPAPAAHPQVGGKGPKAWRVLGLRRDSESSGYTSSDASSDSLNTRGNRINDGPPLTEIDVRNARIDFHVANPPFEAGEWKAHYLGAGGFGIVYVYTRHEDGHVLDRIVVKDTTVPTEFWTAFECLSEIEKAGGTKNCMRMLEHKIDNERMWYRIYSSYCTYQDLHALVNLANARPQTDFPEPFVWSVFNDLVNACLVLQYGAVEEDDAKQDWTPIIHRDFKPPNVFVDTRYDNDPEFSVYPRARLGDFGLAIQTTDDDGHNPWAYAYGGTDGWRPPEQMRTKTNNTLRHLKGKKLGEKTNVWGVGAVIMRLVDRENRPTGPQYFADDHTWVKDKARFTDYAKSTYSKEFVQLVLSCVRFQPKGRPTFRHLRSEILRLTSGPDDLSHGQRDGSQPLQQADRLKLGAENAAFRLSPAAHRSKRQRTQ